MNSRVQDLRLAAAFLRQARILCDGARDFVADDAGHVSQLNKIAAAIAEECAQFDRLIAGAGMDKIEGAEAAAPPDGKPSRIEQLNAELLECERLSHQLDELTATLDSVFGESKTPEHVILKSNADYAEKRLLEKMETLANCLAVERPVTTRDALIFALRALGPLQELLMAVSEEHSYERKQGSIAYKLLQGIVPALEEIAGVTRAGLGFEEPQSETEIIEKLKTALAQKEADVSNDLE